VGRYVEPWNRRSGALHLERLFRQRQTGDEIRRATFRRQIRIEVRGVARWLGDCRDPSEAKHCDCKPIRFQLGISCLLYCLSKRRSFTRSSCRRKGSCAATPETVRGSAMKPKPISMGTHRGPTPLDRNWKYISQQRLQTERCLSNQSSFPAST